MASLRSDSTVGSKELENLILIAGEYFSNVSGKTLLSAKGLLKKCIIKQLDNLHEETVKNIEKASVQARMQFVKMVFDCYCNESKIDKIHIEKAIDLYVQWKRDNAR